MQNLFLVISLIFATTIFYTNPVDAQDVIEFDFDFSFSDYGWVAGFADLPVNHGPSYELEADCCPRPVNLGGANSLYISGSNHSDDLFMYYKKQIGGLEPNTTYNIDFAIELASCYPDGSIGIGGSPANSVYLKAGATQIEPDRYIDDNDYYQMNIDKGIQAMGGEDAIVTGDIAKPDDGNWDYVLINRDNSSTPFSATSDVNGQLWLLFGTDSGFEGTSSLYYTIFSATLEQVTSAIPFEDKGLTNKMCFTLKQNYPNPFNSTTRIRFSLPEIEFVILKIFDISGKEIITLINGIKPAGTHEVELNAENLASGIYFYKIITSNNQQMCKMFLVK